MVQDKITVDLGAAAGINSFISSLFCKKVYATDLVSIIELAEKNYESNKLELESIANDFDMPNEDLNGDKISFKHLDWSRYEEFNFENARKEDKISKYELSQNDLIDLKKAQVFLAADVVYDIDLTANLLNMLVKLMKSGENQPKEAYIALEKRINFDTETLSVSSSAFSFFETSMNELNEYEEDNIRFETQIYSGHFPQYFLNYNRNNYLFIWKIKSSIV